MIIAWVFVNL